MLDGYIVGLTIQILSVSVGLTNSYIGDKAITKF